MRSDLLYKVKDQVSVYRNYCSTSMFDTLAPVVSEEALRYEVMPTVRWMAGMLFHLGRSRVL